MKNKKERIDNVYKELYDNSKVFRNMSMDMQGIISKDLAKLQEWSEREKGGNYE